MSECVESSFVFNRRLRQGSVEALRLWQKNCHTALGQCGNKDGKRKECVFSWTSKEKGHIKICSFLWADNFWIMSPSKKNLWQMLRDLIEEASRWDLIPKPAGSLVDKHV